MIWLIRLYLLLMGVIYFLIGAWAILDPLLGALETGIPSFLGIVGLSISSEIGYSEIAGLYGGINLGIGLMCFVGIWEIIQSISGHCQCFIAMVGVFPGRLQQWQVLVFVCVMLEMT